MKCYIFTDESNTNQARFMLIGGIWVDEQTLKKVNEECEIYKKTIGWKSDTKFNWKNISNKALNNYIGFINIFFKYNLQFNCIVIDSKEIDLKYNQYNDYELGFYIFYYMLLQENSVENIDYYILMDRMTIRRKNILEKIKYWLKTPYMGKSKPKEIINVKTIEFVDSKQYNLIQMTDLLLGAIGSHYNHRHLKPNIAQHKKDFAQYIAKYLGKNDLIFNTDKSGHKNINIWLFKDPSKTKI